MKLILTDLNKSKGNLSASKTEDEDLFSLTSLAYICILNSKELNCDPCQISDSIVAVLYSKGQSYAHLCQCFNKEKVWNPDYNVVV